VDATDIIQNVAEPQETSAEAEPTLAEIHNQKGSSSEDLKFLESNNLKNRNTLYHLDYSTKKMTKQTVDFISLLDDTITAKFVLPQKNDFVPTDLKLISTCTEAGVDTTTELLDDG
jgi:secreted Zn-dependent insulinase-like peptidase